jgi:hypothetical protein
VEYASTEFFIDWVKYRQLNSVTSDLDILESQ